MDKTIYIPSDLFYEVAGSVNTADSRLRYICIILLSIVIHLLILSLTINKIPPFQVSIPSTNLPAISIIIESIKSVAPSIDEQQHAVQSENVQSTGLPDDYRIIDQSNRQESVRVETGKIPANSVDIPIKKPADIELHDVKSLLRESYKYAEKTAKEMEALVDPGTFMTKPFREKLEQARRNKIAANNENTRSNERIFYVNQMGDRVVQIGDRCSIIPAELVPFTFKELNSIIAMPTHCGNKKKNNPFDL